MDISTTPPPPVRYEMNDIRLDIDVGQILSVPEVPKNSDEIVPPPPPIISVSQLH